MMIYAILLFSPSNSPIYKAYGKVEANYTMLMGKVPFQIIKMHASLIHDLCMKLETQFSGIAKLKHPKYLTCRVMHHRINKLYHMRWCCQNDVAITS